MATVYLLTWLATVLLALHLHKRVDRLERRLRTLRASCGAHVGIDYAHTHPIHLHFDE